MRQVLWFLLSFVSQLGVVLSWSKCSVDPLSGCWSRREWLGAASSSLIAASTTMGSHAAGAATATTTTTSIPTLSQEYGGLPVATNPSAGQVAFPALTPPFFHRATFRYTLGRDAWALEQLLTFANVTATIRCTVVKLQTGGLWVHSPQWPTGEFCSLLNDLGAPIEQVVLPCNALEHKAPMQAFVQKYPQAQVWIAPGQYGPFGSCGTSLATKNDCHMGYRVDGILGPDQPLPPWANEFDIATLYVQLPKNAGPVSEVAFCHRPTKTLIATDSLIFVPSQPNLDIFATYFDPQVIQKDPTFWPRTVLQAVFLPLRTQDIPTSTGTTTTVYPGYEAIQNRLIRAPILRALVDARAPDAVREWILQQTTPQPQQHWDYDRILASHFASPIQATPAQVRQAFDYLFTTTDSNSSSTGGEDPSSNLLPPLQCQDWDLLSGINQFVDKANAGAPILLDFTKPCQ